MQQASTCSVPTCEEGHAVRGWCRKHYKRWCRHGDPEHVKKVHRYDQDCSVGTCDRPARSSGLCNGHYQRWRRYGDPEHSERVHLDNQDCSVSTCDRPARIRGLCDGHYGRWRTTGSVDADRPLRAKGKSVCGGKSAYARGCRCELCREAERRRRQDWRRSNPDKARAQSLRASHKRRAVKASVESSVYDAAEVMQRDGWRCGICGQQIGRSYKYPHPRSASIDHIVPLSVGGANTPDNVQAAHLTCNVKKGARGGGQLRLAV